MSRWYVSPHPSYMNFADLHELLRKEIVRRIDAGLLTGTRLAQQTGFQQAHISNFLNARRALSLEGLDRVLDAQKLTAEQLIPAQLLATQLLPSHLLQEPASGQLLQTQFLGVDLAAASGPDPVELVPVVSAATAIREPRIAPSSVIESLHIPATRLERGSPRTHAVRSLWHRFLAIRVDKEQSAAMTPLLSRGALVILDRHYTSLAPLRAAQPNLYAVSAGTALLLRYVDLDQTQLVLRPLSLDHPVQILPLDPPATPASHIVGRVCLQIADL